MPKEYPSTLLEFEHWFRTEDACRSYLVRIRWPEGFRCPRCGHGQAWEAAGGSLRCGKCRVDTSPTAGTIFHGSHVPLRAWFRAIWWVTSQKSGASALGLQKVLGFGSYETAWTCLHKLRRAMVRPGRDGLSGTVEVDEFAVGGPRKGLSGGWRREGEKALVVVAAEVRGEGTGRIRLQRIRDCSGKVLTGFVKQAVAPGSEIITDGWSGYADLPELGYVHSPTTLTGKGREASNVILRRAHRVASLLQRWLLGIHQGRVSRKHLGYYLDEFVFRFNRRSSAHRGMLFYRLLQQAAAIDPAPYRDLIDATQWD